MDPVETGTPDPATPAPVTPGTPAAPVTPVVGSPAAPPAPPTGFTYAEDRSKWVPGHRFNEVSEKAKEAARFQAELATARTQIQALTGGQPLDPKSAKADQVKQAFFEMFPKFKHFDSLSDDQIAKLMQAPEHIARTSDNEARAHRKQGTAALVSIAAHVADALGTDELDSEQKDDLRDDFAGWLKRTVLKEAEASQDGQTSLTLQRYEDADPKLFQEFADRYTKNWVTPARRQATAQTINRARPVPNSQGRSQVTSVKRPEVFKTLDERLDYGAALLKERGVHFER